MNWIFLLLAGITEVFFTAAMSRTEGFTRIVPTVLTFASLALSLYFFSLSVRSIPMSVAYAVWVGVGALGTAVYGIVTLNESAQPLRLACIALILAGIVGLKLLHEGA